MLCFVFHWRIVSLYCRLIVCLSLFLGVCVVSTEPTRMAGMNECL